MSARPALQRTLRPMSTRDIEAVVAIEKQAYSFPWSQGNFIDSMAAGYPAQVLHVLDQGQVSLVGYFVALMGVDELHLLNVTVAPDWQGQGLGTELLRAVCRLGQSKAMPHLFLEVRHSNRRARALYQRLGFVEVGLRRGYYPAAQGREDAVVMRLALSARAQP